jgi:hypothetical protein
MEKADKNLTPFKALLRSMETKKGKYFGIYAEVARRVGKVQPVVYTNVAYSEAFNRDKEVFLQVKAERDERAKVIEEATAKAS